jgi:methylisocitrate lyase
MTWLVEHLPKTDDLSQMFFRQIHAPSITVIPGVYDGLSALLAREAGFESLYLSGAALTASRGWPDLGLLTAQDVSEPLRDIVRATGLPVLVDVDTGFGGVLQCIRTAKEMREVGAAAIQVEDQLMPKKCGHLNGKQLVPTEEMVQKIHAIKSAEPLLVLVARTDAVAIEGLDAAIERAQAYAQAGADVIFPEALRSAEAFQRFRDGISIPLLANMTEFGQTPYITAEEFEAWGYNAVIFPVTALRAAAFAMREVYRTLKATGTQKILLNQLLTRQELYDLIRYFEYEEMDRSILRSTLPGGREKSVTPGNH